MRAEERTEPKKADEVERVPRREMGRDDLENGELDLNKPCYPGWPCWKRPD